MSAPLPEAAAGLPITYRQLDHWTTLGYLHADNDHPGHGRKRRWPEHELAVASAMGRLVALGLVPEAAHRVARAGRESEVRFALTGGEW